jgi:hypothetical protein
MIISAIQRLEVQIGMHRALLQTIIVRMFHDDVKAFDAFTNGLQINCAFAKMEEPKELDPCITDSRSFLEHVCAALYGLLTDARTDFFEGDL